MTLSTDTLSETVTRTSLAAYVLADCLRTYAYTSGPTWKRIIQCYRSPGVHAMIVHRFGYWLRPQPLWVRLLLEPIYFLWFRHILTAWGIDIGRTAQIGPGCYIGHFGGINISGGARIGANCNLSQGITIGLSGKGEKAGVPTIGDNVYIAPGAKLFGKIRIGHNVKIGANAVVHKDVPDQHVVAAPAFVILSETRGNRR